MERPRRTKRRTNTKLMNKEAFARLDTPAELIPERWAEWMAARIVHEPDYYTQRDLLVKSWIPFSFVPPRPYAVRLVMKKE
jgi:hypothetical protein